MTVTLKSMRYFVCALQHRSIAEAAGELNIAASAVASAIDQIEAQFELKLVQRHRSRGIEPTASGKTMVQRFNSLLEEYDSLLLDGTKLKQSLSGNLRIGYYAPVAPAFLPEILGSLTDADGGLTLDMEECDNDVAQKGLLDGSYDAILFVSDSAHPRVEYDTLIEAPAYCLMPAKHPLSANKSIKMSEISDSPIIALNRPVASDYYSGLLSTADRRYRIAAYANSTEMVRSLVGAGLGVAILNMIPATTTSYAGDQLMSLPIADPLPPLTLSVGYEKSNARKLVRHFVDRCRSYFSDENANRCIVPALEA